MQGAGGEGDGGGGGGGGGQGEGGGGGAGGGEQASGGEGRGAAQGEERLVQVDKVAFTIHRAFALKAADAMMSERASERGVVRARRIRARPRASNAVQPAPGALPFSSKRGLG